MMVNLSTAYAGLNMNNPIISSSSGFSSIPAGVWLLVEAGARVVVLQSLFEEQNKTESRYLDEVYPPVWYP